MNIDEYEIVVAENEFYDEVHERFVSSDPCKLVLRHCLRSVVEWECKTKKSFFISDRLTHEDLRLYMKYMTVNGDFDWLVYEAVTADQLNEVSKYMDDPMTASTYTDLSKYGRKAMPRGKIVTAESFYSAMVSLGIPFECDEWHLNRLVALIRFCDVQNNPGKKMAQGDLLRAYADIGKSNKARFNKRR